MEYVCVSSVSTATITMIRAVRFNSIFFGRIDILSCILFLVTSTPIHNFVIFVDIDIYKNIQFTN